MNIRLTTWALQCWTTWKRYTFVREVDRRGLEHVVSSVLQIFMAAVYSFERSLSGGVQFFNVTYILSDLCTSLHPCQANVKSTPQCTRSALHHARQMGKHPLGCARSALYPCQANGKNTRSSLPAQRCIHARQMIRTPAALSPCQANATRVHLLTTVSMPGK